MKFWSRRTARVASRLATSSPKHSAPIRLFILCGLLLVAAVAISTGLILSNLHSRALADSERELGNIAFVLAEQTDRAFQALDVVQTGLIERMQALGITSSDDYERRMAGQDVHLMLKDKIASLPHVDAVTMINAQGKLINFSRYWPIPSINVSDRDYFIALKSNTKLTVFISEPVRNRGTDTWTIYLARKFAAPNGDFLGLVLGAMELQSFERLFGRIVLGEDSAIALFRRDGVLLARYPRRDPPGSSYAAGDLFKTVLSHANRGTVRLTSIVDGQERLVAGHSIARYPLVVAVATTTAAVLADWRRLASYLIGVATLTIIVIAGIIVLSVRQFKNFGLLVQARSEKAEADKLRQQKLQLDTALNNMSQGLCMFDAEGRLVICNDLCIQMYGLSREVIKPGCTLYELINHRKETGSFPGDPKQYFSTILAAIARGETATREVETTDGRMIHIVNRPMENGGWVVTHEDITKQRNTEQERDRNREFLDLIIENVPVTIYAKKASDRRYVLVNRAGEKFWEMPRNEMLGKTAYDVFPKEEADQIAERDEQVFRSHEQVWLDEHPLNTRSNGTRIVTSKRLVIRSKDGEAQYLLGVIEDVTERKRADERIAYLAHHDIVTNLPNRLACMECLASVLDRAAKAGERFAILCIDLDRFKEVNDVFGHSVGDALLSEASRRLQAAVGGAFLARVGGDEFTVISTDGEQPSNAEALADRLLAAVADDIEIEGRHLRIGLSIGVAIYPTDGADATKLLANADAALYRVKAEARGSMRFFDADLDRQLRDQRALQHDLSLAIDNGELSLHYQPLAKLSGEVLGFEALLRWQHPIWGMVPPNTFIPLAEKSGLIISIGEWVLSTACHEAASWPKPLRIAVNLSPMQFHHRDFPALVHSVLLETGLSPNRLELEITESVLIDDFSRGVSMLRRLKALGVRIVMDDFGIGYSSLSYLHSFPFDKIKIDRVFISDLEHNRHSATIVRAVISLARGLKLPVAAEGVETEGQLAFLAHEGCDEVQGYLLGRPYPIEEYAELIGHLTMAKQKSALAG
jgi:diguanylate cyclase (GGDEF)-like protein/PAS domain S-box-containing protein